MKIISHREQARKDLRILTMLHDHAKKHKQHDGMARPW